MNKKFMLSASLFLIFFLPGLAMSAELRMIHVDLSYSGSAVSYNLYKDGVMVCVSNEPNAIQLDCNVEIGETPMSFVLTAVDAAGVESPESAPYILTPPATVPGSGNSAPLADFTTNVAAGVVPLPVSFDASGSSDLGGMILSYSWDFGDGGTGTGKLFDYLYTVPGTYTVTLTVVDDGGASAQKTASIVVGDQPPEANNPPIAVISASALQANTSLIGFDAASSSDSDGTLASFSWNFGDGETAVGSQVEHEFLAAGDYTVVLTVTDNLGASSQDQMIMTIVDATPAANLPPTAMISASSQKRSLHFDWEYTGSDPGLAGFRLYQNGRLVCEVADPAARQADCLSHVDNGMVHLWVTSYDQSAVEGAASAAFSFDSTGMFPEAGGNAPLAVHFTAGNSSDPDGSITSYHWDFGDGSTAEGGAVDQVFTVPGDYTVTMIVTDSSGVQVQAQKVIRVTDGNPPIAVNASLSITQDKSLTATMNASDSEGRPLTFRVLKNGVLGTATITDTARGVFTYVPRAGVLGADTITFKANDGTFDSNAATVAIAIKKNSAPIVNNQARTVLEDTTLSATLTASDADNDQKTFSLVTLPLHGTVTLVNAGTGAFTYKPAVNYYGPDSFTFKASDGKLSSVAGTVTITVTAVNDAPTATNVKVSVKEDVKALGKLVGVDPEGKLLAYSIVTNGSKGKAVITNVATGAFSYTPIANNSGTDSFVYRVSDGKLTKNATGTVTIAPVNDAPTARADLVQVSRGKSVTIPVRANDSDIDGNPLTLASVTVPAYGKAAMVKGAIVYTANATFVGKVTFTYKVTDGKGGAANGTVTVTVVR